MTVNDTIINNNNNFTNNDNNCNTTTTTATATATTTATTSTSTTTNNNNNNDNSHVPNDTNSDGKHWFLGSAGKGGDVFLKDVSVVVEVIGN